MNIKTKQVTPFEFELFKQYSSHDILPIAYRWKNLILKKTSALDVAITGELRRGKSSLSHIDFVVSSENIPITNAEILSLSGIRQIINRTNNFLEFKIENDISLLVWIAVPSELPTALLYTTGPSAHTDWLDAIALQNGKHISFHGCWAEKHLVDIESETAIYRFLGLPFFPPEVRELNFDQDEIINLYFQNLIEQEDIRSDLHIHTNWSDGTGSIEEIAREAIKKDLSLIAITDHSPILLKPRYKNANYFLSQHKEIEEVEKKYGHRITILKGAEVDILPDGNLDLPKSILQTMDIIVASLHFDLDQPRTVITDRLIKAIENPYVDIIGHPGGRLYPMHDIADIDWERVFHAAAFHRVALEINSHKAHPLFDDQKVRRAIECGVPICLNSDAHSIEMLHYSVFGINIARRAGLEKDQVINTWSPTRLKNWLEMRKVFTAMQR